MKAFVPLYSLGLISLVAPTHATLILAENFNGPDNGNFDNYSQNVSVRSGVAASDIQLRSSRRQHGIIGNQLDFAPPAGGSGRIRFHDNNNLANWWDWSSGSVGSLIVSSGGFQVDFDWVAPILTTGDWVSWNVGFSQGAEPTVRVNEAQTDFGILFRGNGGTQYFDNGSANTGGNFTATSVARHVTLNYNFSSWADGSVVTVTASVDGTPVLGSGQTFAWDNNTGGVSFELGTNEADAGTRIDNFTITAVPEPSAVFLSGLAALVAMGRRRRVS